MDFKDKPTLMAGGALAGVVASSVYFTSKIKTLEAQVEELQQQMTKMGDFINRTNASNKLGLQVLAESVDELSSRKLVSVPDKGPAYVRTTKRRKPIMLEEPVEEDEEDDDLMDAINSMA